MINIEIQTCGIVLLLLVGFFYFQLPKLKIRTKQVFGRLLLAALLCTTTDIISVFAIYYSQKLPSILVSFSCKLYLVCLVMLMFSGFIYLSADIFAGKKIFEKMTTVTEAFFTIIVLSIQFLPIKYVCADNGRTIYSYGSYTIAVYIIFGLVFIAMLTLAQFHRKAIQKRRRTAINIWLFLWFSAALLQLFNNRLLVASFAGCLGVLIIFLMIENPELALDKSSRFFHASVIPQYITEAYCENDFFLINTRFSINDTGFFETIKNAVIFVGNGEIYLFFNKREYYSTALAQISARMNKRLVYACEDKNIAENVNDLLSMFKEAHNLMRTGKVTHFTETLANVCPIDRKLKATLEKQKAEKKMITEALAEDRIEPFFQPIYSIATGKFNSAEALARIRDRDGSIISPFRFIPVAEEDGSIIGIGKKIYEKTCEFLRDEKPDTLGLEYIEINLSVVQGEDKRLAEYISSALNIYKIRPEQINLEITESASISGRAQLLDSMHKLIEQGFSFSLDDFGTGQSNLDYMTMMPVRLVKFDRSMTQSYFTSDKTKCVMSAAVKMIHDLGLKVVIEGVETADELDEMKKLGADYIQGYYFSKPLCMADFVEFIKKHN